MTASGAETSTASDTARVAQVERMLAETPRGVGPVCDDRAAWEKVARAPACEGIVKDAEKVLSRPIAGLMEEIHEDLSGGRVPIRFGIVLTETTERARVTVKITPVE